MRKNILAIGLVTFLLGASCIQAHKGSNNEDRLSVSSLLQKDNYRSIIKKQFNASRIKNLDVHTISSDIEVTGDAGSTASLEVLAKGPNNKALSGQEIQRRLQQYYTITSELTDGTLWVKVELKTKRIPSNQGLNMKFVLHTPGNAVARLQSISGDIEVQGAGSASIATTSGDIELSDIKGDLKSTSVSGDVEAHRIKGSFAARTTSGDIEASGIGSMQSAVTTSGDIELTANVLDKDAKIRSTSGDVKLHLAGHTKFNLTAGTVSGDIDLSALGDAQYGTKSKRKVVAQINGGGQPLNVETISGDILISQS